MDLAEDGSEDGTSTPTKNEASTILPTTTEKPTDSNQKGTPTPDWRGTPSSKINSSDDEDTEDEEYRSTMLQWLGLDSDCKGMLHHEATVLAHHLWTLGIKAVPAFQQAVNEDPEVFIEAREPIKAAV